jgi:hypothetical protein
LAASATQSTPASTSTDADGTGPRLSWWKRCKRNLQECFLGFPEEYQAPPLGHFVYLHAKTEIANAEAARMVLYQYDFMAGGDQLTPRGCYQVEKIATMLPRTFFPVIIEAMPGHASLYEARRLTVLNELAKYPFPIPPERVVIGRPLAVGLAGPEAELVYQNLILQTQNKGVAAGGGAGQSFGNVPLVGSNPAGGGAGAGGGGAGAGGGGTPR